MAMLRQVMLGLAVVAAMPALAEDGAPPASADPSDYALEQIVRAAYVGAADFARRNGNYFARDGVFAPLREAVLAELAGEGLAGVTVPEAPAASFADAQACLAAPGRELRIASNLYGDGIDLVAVSSTRVVAYRYDPHDSTSLTQLKPTACAKAK